MPSRIIREDLLESDRYQAVNIEAKLCFIHLLLLADDFGCVSVSPAFLRRRCFFSSVPDERISRVLMELVDVDLIRTYEVDRKCLAFIPRYRQRLQRSTLKHPKPPPEVYQDDPDAKTKFNNINEKNQFSTVAQPLPNREQPLSNTRREEKGREEKRSEGAQATNFRNASGFTPLAETLKALSEKNLNPKT